MANLGYTFDATQVEPNAPRELLPPGKYVAQIVKSEMKPTNSGGEMLEIELDIIEGEFQNRKLWDRLNLVNTNPKAQEIALRTLSAICHATGKLAVQDSEELHFKPLMVTVKVQPERTDPKSGRTYAPSNVISGYEAINGTPATPVATQRAAAHQQADVQTSAKPATATPPWRRAG